MDPIQRLVGSVVPAATAGQPVISVDTKKMELLGCYNNAGSDYRPRVRPRRVKAQTSRTKSLAKLSRNRGYDLTDSTGRVNVRVDHDTAEFAVNTIRRWLASAIPMPKA